jgi:hypothetical protein
MCRRADAHLRTILQILIKQLLHSYPSIHLEWHLTMQHLLPLVFGKLYEINPCPPARLLITAVVIASAKSVAPFDSPPELINP